MILNNKFTLPSIAVLFGLGAAVALAYAAPGPISSPSPGASPSSSATPGPTVSAAPFVTAAVVQLNSVAIANLIHHIDGLEIQENQLAQTRLQNSSNQQLSETLSTNFQSNQQQLLTLAASADLPLYEFQSATFETAIDSQLSLLPNSDYDNAYLQVELGKARRFLADLQLAAAQNANSTLQPIINSTLAMLQSHINLIVAALGGVSPSPSPSVSPSPSPSASPSSSPSASPSPSSSPSIGPMHGASMGSP
ncbi:MAG: DUF4142 domain-containing protein [Oligoflexia bacterium]|nr:DUF4142 domain-containing protein [Oligoflexia bacterium]